MHIRPARADDAERLADLLKQLGYVRTPAELVRHISASSADPQTIVLVAERPGGAIVGCLGVLISARLAEGDGGEITSLVVDAELRGRGIGAALVRSAAEWVQSRGMTRLRVRCNAKREKAQSFYTHLGFQNTKVQKVYDMQLRTHPTPSLNP